MNAEPLSKEIYDKAKSLGITKIGLHFSGGSDEGDLYVETRPEYAPREFVDEIEEWVWENYQYSGAGDGESRYGDDIVYNLETNEVTTKEWYHVVQEEEAQTSTFKVK